MSDDLGLGHLAQDALRRIGARQRARQPEDKAAVRAEHRRLLVKAGMGLRLAELVTTDDLRQTEAIDLLNREFSAGTTIAVVAGGPGVGKSVAAAAWLLQRLEQHGGDVVRWLQSVDLGRLASFDAAEQQKQFEQVGFLVIDDLGNEHRDSRGYFTVPLDSIIHQRHANRRQTVITTNLTMEVFRERYGERIADRLRECGAFLQVAGESMRRPLPPAVGDLGERQP